MKKIIISIVLVGFISAVNQTHAANNSFFKVSNNSVNFGKKVTLSWSVPNATECYLHSPTSAKPNVPDTVPISGKKVSLPDAVYSDFATGERATYTLSCVDKTKLDKNGNYTSVYSKSRIVKLTKPRTLDSELNIYNPITDDTLLINPPKKWARMDDTGSNIIISYDFKDIKRAGSITFFRVDKPTIPGEGLPITDKKVSERKIDRLSSKVIEYNFQGMHYYDAQLLDGSRKYEIVVEVPISKMSSRWPAVMQSLDTIRIVSGKLDK